MPVGSRVQRGVGRAAVGPGISPGRGERAQESRGRGQGAGVLDARPQALGILTLWASWPQR